MPIVFDNSSNTLLQFAVAPTTIADESFLTLVWPADLPNPSGLLQCDADGIMRWTSAAGLPPGAVRSYTGAFVGSVGTTGTPTTLQRAAGTGTSIVVPKPTSDPSGFYVEAVVRALSPANDDPAFVRVFTGIYYSAGTYTASGNISYQGDVPDYLTKIAFPVSTLQDGTQGAAISMSVTATAGTTVNADLVVFGSPQPAS